jgi:alkylation response protein AidB-like acyl-CoA dehydrogenase
MDFNLSDEQQMLRDGADRYFSEHYTFEQRKGILASAQRCSAEQWAQFADLGWLSLSLPEDAGGLACSFIETALVMEAMGRRLVLEPYATTAVLCAPILEKASNRSAGTELLANIGAGTLRMALAYEEPGARDQLNGASTVRRQGDNWVLNGTKMLVTAAAELSAGPSVWVVDSDAPGVRLESYALIDGTLAADVSFTNVILVPTALLVESARGAEVLDDALDRIVLSRVAEALGAMDMVMRITAEQIKNRTQFGQPLSKFQALQHRMSEMFVEVQETRSILYRALASIEAAPPQRRAAVSAAKVVASAAGRIVGGQGIQLHGAVGVTEEYPVGHYFRRLIALEKSFGDADFHLARLAGTYR